jgi:hypothetical protein
MHRWAVAGVAATLGCGTATLVCAPAAAPAGAATHRSSTSPSVTVSPSRGLTEGQTVTITGKGFPKPGSGSTLTWFVTQCTAAVHGHLNASTDTPHCDVTSAKAVHLTKNGTFTAHYRVETGIIGDGYCGTAGHLTCIMGVGTATGTGTVVKITFRSPPPYPGSAPAPPPAPSSTTTTTTT